MQNTAGSMYDLIKLMPAQKTAPVASLEQSANVLAQFCQQSDAVLRTAHR